MGTMIAGLPVLAAAQPVTGPYVSVGAGVNLQQNEIVTAVAPNDFSTDVIYTFHPGFAGRAGAGYGFGNGFRAEIEGDYTDNVVRGGQDRLSDGLSPSRRAGGVEQKYGGFADVLYDFSLGLPVQPYLGVGAGGLDVEHNGFNQSLEGARVMPSAPIPGVPHFGFHDQTVGGFAYKGIAGLALPIAFVPGLSFTAEYDFVGLLDPLPAFQNVQSQYRYVANPPAGGVPGSPFPHYEHVAVSVNRHFTNDYNHEILLGFRYALFQPPRPLPAQAAPEVQPSAPVPQARTFLVFFDWDRADLPARARQIVAQAAAASRQPGTTQVAVDGYTDLSGTAAYNQRLSVRRAESVKVELVRDGVPASEIAIAGHGETNPLVATAPGVREPQNRRVEIMLR